MRFMTRDLEIKIAKISWLQNFGLALFAAGFIILGFIYAVSSNATSAASYVMSVPHASPPTTNATVQYIFQNANQISSVLFVASMIFIILGAALIFISARRLKEL